ncbi:hypothetical protein, partial [Burkholderia vietnamiensis]|uniref:hypothetical protein n=1 Tax=Burkholderia vietnamiensis TaxID=60552 RepID=UPI001CF5C9BD
HGFASTVPSGASPAFARKRLTVLKGGLDLLRAKWLIITLRPTRSAFDWKSAMNQFAILFGERFMQARG